MNKVCLVGRLTKDPELRSTTSGRAVCQFTVAINRTFTNQNGQREADFIPVVVWDKSAENLARYMHKGSLVSVDGRIQTRNYEKDGQRRYVTEVVADNVQFLDSKSSGSSAGNDDFGGFNDVSPSDFSSQMPTTEVKNDPFADFGASIEINDDELPF